MKTVILLILLAIGLASCTAVFTTGKGNSTQKVEISSSNNINIDSTQTIKIKK